jgi:hypothetical protein
MTRTLLLAVVFQLCVIALVAGGDPLAWWVQIMQCCTIILLLLVTSRRQ